MIRMRGSGSIGILHAKGAVGRHTQGRQKVREEKEMGWRIMLYIVWHAHKEGPRT